MTHRLMHEHVSKRAKMQRSKETKRVAKSKEGKHKNITQSKERVCIKKTGIVEVYLTSGHTHISHKRDECNNTSKWPQRPTRRSPQRV